jgi:hypothetical protein
MSIRLVANGSQPAQIALRMAEGLKHNRQMLNLLESAQERIIGKRVKRFFRANSVRKPTTVYQVDPSKHEYVGGLGKFTTQIVNNITTGHAPPQNYIIVVGTGFIDKLDDGDPIRRLRKPSRNIRNIDRIWRFLEAGTKAHQIKGRGAGRLKFLLGIDSPAGLILGEIFTKAVRHPGYKGRDAFFKGGTTFGERTPYRNDFKIIASAHKMVRGYMKRFSAI